MAEFDAWAPYYDLVHTGLPGEASFYAMRGMQCGGEVLELGCGTGRIAIPLAMTGAQVTGLDLSRKMLSVCRQKVQEIGPMKGSLKIVHGDMRAFSLEARFPLIIAPYRTFMHLLSSEDQIRCLGRIREHLAPDGHFLFNVWAAKASAIARVMNAPKSGALKLVKKYRLHEEKLVLRHYHAARYAESSQRISEVHRFEHVSISGELLDTHDLKLERTWFYPRELEHLLRRCGFRITESFGDFSGTPFSAHSSEMIIAATPEE